MVGYWSVGCFANCVVELGCRGVCRRECVSRIGEVGENGIVVLCGERERLDRV